MNIDMNKNTLLKLNIVLFSAVLAIILVVSYTDYIKYCSSYQNVKNEIYITELDKSYTIETTLLSAKHSFTAFLQESAGSIVILLITVMVLANLYISKVNRRIFNAMSIDELTGLPNRKYFNKAAERVLSDSKYEETTVFILDIDHFKDINDTFGHHAGDLVLAEVGSILKKVVSRPHIAARWGGDEFVGIIYGDNDMAKEFMTNLKHEISANKILDKYSVTVSIGVDLINQRNDVNSIFLRADNALYTSKDNGRNCITFFSEVLE